MEEKLLRVRSVRAIQLNASALVSQHGIQRHSLQLLYLCPFRVRQRIGGIKRNTPID